MQKGGIFSVQIANRVVPFVETIKFHLSSTVCRKFSLDSVLQNLENPIYRGMRVVLLVSDWVPGVWFLWYVAHFTYMGFLPLCVVSLLICVGSLPTCASTIYHGYQLLWLRWKKNKNDVQDWNIIRAKSRSFVTTITLRTV